MMKTKELFCARLISSTGTLYHIETLGAGTEAVFAVQSSGSLHLWHWQLAHIRVDRIREMQHKGMVEGLTISSPVFDHICEGCALGKAH